MRRDEMLPLLATLLGSVLLGVAWMWYVDGLKGVL